MSLRVADKNSGVSTTLIGTVRRMLETNPMAQSRQSKYNPMDHAFAPLMERANSTPRLLSRCRRRKPAECDVGLPRSRGSGLARHLGKVWADGVRIFEILEVSSKRMARAFLRKLKTQDTPATCVRP